ASLEGLEDDRRVVRRRVLAELARLQHLLAVAELVEVLELALGDLAEARALLARVPVRVLVRWPAVDADAGLAGVLVLRQRGVEGEVLLPAGAARDLALQLPRAEALLDAPRAHAD